MEGFVTIILSLDIVVRVYLEGKVECQTLRESLILSRLILLDGLIGLIL